MPGVMDGSPYVIDQNPKTFLKVAKATLKKLAVHEFEASEDES